jgi:3-deoxy-D-manno-octulosonic-acid transferase
LTRPIYTLLLYLIAPFVFLRLAWRSIRAPEYRRRWGERLGKSTTSPLADSIWLHAVSVGEVQAAVPLVRALIQAYPNRPLVITTTTPTGSQRVRDVFGDQVFHVYIPYDLPFAVSRFLRSISPSIAIIMETELWPNLFHGCRARGVPVVVANARLSEKSMAGYRRVARLARETLADVTIVAAQGRSDGERFRTLGAAPDALRITGSIKFDIKLAASLREEAEVLRRQLGSERPVWIAASTHEGEDEQVLEAFDRVRNAMPDCLLVLVPRHPERFARVAAMCRRHGFPTVLRSEKEFPEASTRVYLGDTLGDLPLLYAASDVAFVGGSLVPLGGHNVLEPAALGLPVITGPHTFNFDEIVGMLLDVKGAQQVKDADQLAACVELFLRDANTRHLAGENGRKLVEDNRGALERLLVIVNELLGDQKAIHGCSAPGSSCD